MNTTNPRTEFPRHYSFDEIQDLIRQGRIERSMYVASSIRGAVSALGRWGRQTLRRLASGPRAHDLSGRPA